MSPRGRQTSNPKELSTRIRLSDTDIKMLNDCVIMTGESRSQIIRNGIKKIYREEVKNMTEFTMQTKYDGTIRVDDSASASVARDIVSEDISAYFICMNDRNFEVSKTVFDAVVKKFNLMVDLD